MCDVENAVQKKLGRFVWKATLTVPLVGIMALIPLIAYTFKMYSPASVSDVPVNTFFTALLLAACHVLVCLVIGAPLMCVFWNLFVVPVFETKKISYWHGALLCTVALLFSFIVGS